MLSSINAKSYLKSAIVIYRSKPSILYGLVLFFCLFFNEAPAQKPDIAAESQVTIRSAEESVAALKGLFHKKEAKGKMPAVLLVNAHAFSDGDLSASGTTVYRDLSDRLAQKGYPVLRMHSRAWIDNSYSPSQLLMEDIHGDLMESLEWLKRETGSKTERIWLIAYGEQALSALWLCKHSEEVAGVILLQPLAFSVVEHVCRQTAQVLVSSSLPDSTSTKYLDLLYVMLRAVRNQDDPDRAYKELNAIVENHLMFFSDWEVDQLALSKSDRKFLLQHLNSPYMRSFVRLQSRQLYTECSVPVHIFYGADSDPEWLQRNFDVLESYKSEKTAPGEIEIYKLQGLGPFLSSDSPLEVKTARKDRKIADIVMDLIFRKLSE